VLSSRCQVEASTRTRQSTYVSKLAIAILVLWAVRVLVQFAQQREYMYYGTRDKAVTYCQPRDFAGSPLPVQLLIYGSWVRR
jgi:hypothetical protein